MKDYSSPEPEDLSLSSIEIISNFQINKRESRLFETHLSQKYINQFFKRLSQFYKAPIHVTSYEVVYESNRYKLQMYSVLSFFFRLDEKYDAATDFLEYFFFFFFFQLFIN